MLLWCHVNVDPLVSICQMVWETHQLMTDPAHLFDANIFYPERLTLTLSDPIILPALMQAPLIAAGVPFVVAYNIVFLSSLWVSGIAPYLLVARLSGCSRAWSAAGLIYAVYLYRL